jgi:hypothetical protein
VANSCFPDGLYQFIPNNKYINRPGPVYGWENYLDAWGKEQKDIVSLWRTEGFTPNAALIATLKSDFKK